MGKIIQAKYTFLNYAIALFFLASPIESIAIFEGFSIAKLSAIIVLIGWATQGFKVKSSLMVNNFVILAVYATMSVLWSIDRNNTLSQCVVFLWPSIVVTIALNYSIKKSDDIFLYLKAYLIGCVISIVSTFIFRDIALASAEYAGQERLTAFGQDQNTLAYLLCIGFTIVLDYFRRIRNGWYRYFCLLFLVLCVVVILSTGSRTGVILAVFIFSLYIISSGSFKNLVPLLFLIFLLSPIIYNYIPESIWDRFLETSELVESGNFSDRGVIWSSGLSALSKENFLLGVGYSNFSEMLRQHFGWQMASHNTYLSYLVDLGIVGFILFFIIIFRMLLLAKRIKRLSGDIYIYAYIIPFLVVMFVLETEYKRWIFIIGVLLESYLRLQNMSRTKYVDRNSDKF